MTDLAPATHVPGKDGQQRVQTAGIGLDFQRLYQAKFAYVCKLLRKWGVPARDLEDVVHDVFVVVHRKRSDWDPSTPIEPWIAAISFRTASDWRRRAFQRQDLRADLGDPADGAPSALDRAERSQARSHVEMALGELDEAQRVVFVLHELEGHAMPEVARALGIGVNTAYSRLRLGRQRFVLAIRKLRGGAEARP
ncbi:MAG: sigma-70 family RNA polymerase sigma factor [Deltaproteobacteria bacterium]|nr:sigma-70 family RNA polymerase sigma factor [Deltaproteobacteria bacterium]